MVGSILGAIWGVLEAFQPVTTVTIKAGFSISIFGRSEMVILVIFCIGIIVAAVAQSAASPRQPY
jgi:hypothetical protein